MDSDETTTIDHKLTRLSGNTHNRLGTALRVEMRLKNNRLMSARLEAGCKTVAVAANYIGISQSLLSAYETLLAKPYNINTGEWKDTAQLIAEFYGYSCEELWPEEVVQVKERALSLQLASMPNSSHELEDDVSTQRLLPERVLEVLEILPPREREVLMHRFGLGGLGESTWDEVAAKIANVHNADDHVGSSRVAQLEAHALRCLRHPKISILLKYFTAEPSDKQLLNLSSTLPSALDALKRRREEASSRAAKAEADRLKRAHINTVGEAKTGLKCGTRVWYFKRDEWIQVELLSFRSKTSANIRLDAADREWGAGNRAVRCSKLKANKPKTTNKSKPIL